jgi:hypothetical protein
MWPKVRGVNHDVPLASLLPCLAERPDRARALRTIRCLSLRRTNNARPNRARFCSGSSPAAAPASQSGLHRTKGEVRNADPLRPFVLLRTRRAAAPASPAMNSRRRKSG